MAQQNRPVLKRPLLPPPLYRKPHSVPSVFRVILFSRAHPDEATCLSGNSSGKHGDCGRFQFRRLNMKAFDGFASRGCNPRTQAAPFCRPTRKGLNILRRDVFDPVRVVPERGEPAYPRVSLRSPGAIHRDLPFSRFGDGVGNYLNMTRQKPCAQKELLLPLSPYHSEDSLPSVLGLVFFHKNRFMPRPNRPMILLEGG